MIRISLKPFLGRPYLKNHFLMSSLLLLLIPAAAASQPAIRDVPIAPGWAQNSVNAVIFRTHAVTTAGETQYAAYYDPEARVKIARRTLGETSWKIHDTGFTGNVRDAHNAICLAVDGDGYLHLSWDHHGHDLRYRRSTEPGKIEFGEAAGMTGQNEERVTYPEFYNLADGGFVFMYRQGGSGRGNILLNRYNPETRSWSPLQHPLIDGEGKRNAYTNQIAIDHLGHWHLSWTWRDTSDVATNHDILYAMSPDEGVSWFTSTGQPHDLPITAETAEVVAKVPHNSELINQCSSAVDANGNPMIATYWRPEGSDSPQYMLVWHDGETWHTSRVSDRKTPFRLSGGGTRRIPISRPKLAVAEDGTVYMIYRDEERGSRISVAATRDPNRREWEHFDLTEESVNMWEPNYDTVLWQREGVLHLFKQHVGQGQRETLEDLEPQTVSILEWTPPARPAIPPFQPGAD